MSQAAVTAQDPVSGKNFGRLSWGSPDRDQALAFPKRGLLQRTKRPLDASRTGASKKLPALLPPTTPRVGVAADTGRTGRVENVVELVADKLCSTRTANRRREAGIRARRPG